jgi:hypothetical protein
VRSSLGRALPAALAHSGQQAGAHLPAADVARLRTFALTLVRVPGRWDIQLPVAIIDLLLSHIDAPMSP